VTLLKIEKGDFVMEKILLLMVMLLTVTAHAGEKPGNDVALHENLKTVERQFVESGLQPEDAQATVRAMVRAHFTEEQMVRAGRQVASGDGQGLAAGAVRAKIHEGIAKGVAPETILKATSKVKNRYDVAEKFALKLKQTELVGIYADCLAAGLSEKDAQTLTSALQARKNTPDKSESRNLAVETLVTARDMVRQEVSSKTTGEVLESALRRGYGEKEMRTLRHTLAGNTRDNLEESARHIGAAIDHGDRPGELQGQGNHGFGSGEKAGMGEGHGAGGSSSSGGSDSSGSDGSGGDGSGGEGSGGEGDGGGGNGGNGGSGGGGNGGGHR
jgi:hypothetical protein